MRNVRSLELILSLLLLVAGVSYASQASLFIHEAAQDDNSPFTAIVTKNKARFVIPIPARSEWRWREPTTRDNSMEYRGDVTVHNANNEYTFGFYLWKRGGSRAGKGSLSDLLAAGQKSLFHVESSRHAVVIRDAGVKVKLDGQNLIVTVEGQENVERLFSSRPAEVTFKILLPNEPPVTQVATVTYKD